MDNGDLARANNNQVAGAKGRNSEQANRAPRHTESENHFEQARLQIPVF
jgi:hypothetical protein